MRQGREVYVRGQIQFLKLSMENFLFSLIVYILPDLGGQGMWLHYYIQPLVVTGNSATHLPKHTRPQWDCLTLTEDLSLIKDFEGTVRPKWKPGGSGDSQHVEKRSLNIDKMWLCSHSWCLWGLFPVGELMGKSVRWHLQCQLSSDKTINGIIMISE